MTYTQLVDCIFKWCELKGLSPSARICVLSLFHHWKLKGCPESFKTPLRSLYEQVGASHPTMLLAIKAMEQDKILVVKKGGPRVPSTYKVMVKVMVKNITVSGVTVSFFTKKYEHLYTRSNTRSNTNTNTNTNNRPNIVKCSDNPRITLKQPLTPQKPKKLSMWVLRGQKDACETELKGLRDKGAEYAMGFEYDSRADKTRAKELRKKIVAIVMQMQEAEQ